MKKIGFACVAAAMAAVCMPAQAESSAGTFSLTAGVDYTTGKYGGTQSTDIWTVPVIGKYETNDWLFSLTVPYIRVTGPGNAVRGIGNINNFGKRKAVPSSSTTTYTESGLGDVVASASRNVYAQGGAMVDLTGKIKFGTADADKGLGTGENDYSLQVDAYHTLDKTTVLGTLGYKVVGDPSGISLNNIIFGSLGADYKFSPDTSAGAILDLSAKTLPDGFDQRELTVYASHALNKNWKAQAYMLKGFSDASPDWGGGANVSYRF